MKLESNQEETAPKAPRRKLVDNEAIRTLIKRNGLTQKEFAEKIGLTPNYLSKLLDGQSKWTADTFIEAALCLNTIVENLISRNELSQHEYFFINSLNSGDNMNNSFNNSSEGNIKLHQQIHELMTDKIKLQEELIQAQKTIIELKAKLGSV